MKKRFIIISIITVILDQLIKFIVKTNIHDEIVVIPKFFYLTCVKNTGGAFSILSNNPYLLAVIGIIVIAGIVTYLIKKKINNNLELIAFSMLTGGIIGNLIDRIVFGGVYDYIGLIFGSYYYPIFNLADSLIVISIGILLIREIKGDKNGRSSNR